MRSRRCSRPSWPRAATGPTAEEMAEALPKTLAEARELDRYRHHLDVHGGIAFKDGAVTLDDKT